MTGRVPLGLPRLWPWVLVSMLVHLVLVAPARWWFDGRTPQRKMLVIDWEGMMSQRQLEEKQQGDPTDSRKEAASRQRQEPPQAQQQSRNMRQQATESPVAAEQASPMMSSPTTASAISRAVSVQADKGEDENREQQTIRNRDAEMDAIRQYLGEVKKAIQARLVYPSRARLGGYTGAPVIRFRIDADGGIVAGTLAVARSSGHALLDEQALAAARASAPLPKPPKSMEVAIAVTFAEDRPGLR